MLGRFDKCFAYFVIAMSYYGVYKLGIKHAVNIMIQMAEEEGANK